MLNKAQIIGRLGKDPEVRQDPSYINQAKQISNSANTLVNITKTKIMMMKGR